MEPWRGYHFHLPGKQMQSTPATLQRNQLLIENQPSVFLGKFIGSGSQGMVFASRDGSSVIKLETGADRYPGHMEFYMNLNEWASDNDVGPKFLGWGPVTIDAIALRHFKALSKKIVPHWLEADEPGQVYYSIYERWDSDLSAYVKRDIHRFYDIDNAVMLKFVERIRRLHQRQVVHLDLMPKNILVRVVDDKVQDMVMTDFGFARPRPAWFFNVRPERRQRVVRYYGVLENSTRLWAEQVGEQEFAEWLEREPFNADWCLVANYALLHNWPSLKQIGKTPPYFNFTLPWSIKGWLEVEISDGQSVVQLSVYGLMSLSKLRDRLVKEGTFNMKKLKFQSSGTVVKIKDERTLYPSSVIVEVDKRFVINLLRRKK